MDVDEARRAVHGACLQMVADGLVIGSAGNISVRVDDARFVVTAAGVPYAQLAADDNPVVDLQSGAWDGRRRPTSEIALHLGVLRSMPDVGSVVHTHSRYAAAFAVARLDLPFICNESIATRAERVLVTDYAPPGSVDLGKQALTTFRRQAGSRAVLLANHGVVAIGSTVDDAYVVAQSVEWTAEICHLARTLVAAGAGETVLDREVQAAIARNYGVTIAGEGSVSRASPRASEQAGSVEADDVIARFGLVPLDVEGGFLNRYWPGPDDTTATAGSAIWFLVTDAPEGSSQFHRLTIDEIWHRYLGDPAELVLLGADGSSRHVVLGGDLAAGHELVHVVPAGTWMACRTTGRWSLLGTTMAPGFTPGCFEAGAAADLAAGWPDEAAAIAALTRDGPGAAG